MARIPESEIERIKREISVQRLVEAAGILLTKSGKDLVGLCPFHDDHDPSLRITPGTNLWRCPPCDIGGGPELRIGKGRLCSHGYDLGTDHELRNRFRRSGADPIHRAAV